MAGERARYGWHYVCALGATVVALLAVATQPAQAARYQGQTSQQRSVSLRTDEADYVSRIRLSWHALCSRGNFRAVSHFFPDFSLGPGRVRVRPGTIHRRDGVRTYAVRAAIRGRRTSRRRWSGTFGANVVIRDYGRVVARCSTGTLRWHAVAPPRS